MKILLFGRGGQVGWELQRSLAVLGQVVALDFDQAANTDRLCGDFGDLAGLTEMLRAGYFEELGVRALWISPLNDNPDDRWPWYLGLDAEAYHGYWPSSPRSVEPLFGGEAAAHALVAEAHARGIRIILDVVPNHVHQAHPDYIEHADDDWFGDAGCVCGSDSCPWATHLQSCWFAPYLPDVRWQQPEALRSGVADARWWLERFDLDGVRIDAVPMMPRAATRRIAHSLRTAVAPASSSFLLGEIFTGPGVNALEMLRFQLGPDGLGLEAEPAPWAGDIVTADMSLEGASLTFQIAVRWSTETGEGGLGRAGSEFLGAPEELLQWLEAES